LLRFYNQPKAAVTRVLRELLTLPGVRVLDRSAVLNALKRMKQSPLSFSDAFLAEKAEASGIPIAPFDADLRKTSLAALPLNL
jgi:predicted nucleic acid-binding protein